MLVVNVPPLHIVESWASAKPVRLLAPRSTPEQSFGSSTILFGLASAWTTTLWASGPEHILFVLRSQLGSKWPSCSNVRTFSFESRAFRLCGLHSVSFLLVPLSCYRLVMQHQDLLPVSTVFLSKPNCSIHRTQQTQTQVLCSLIVLISICPLLLRTAVQRIQVVWQ